MEPIVGDITKIEEADRSRKEGNGKASKNTLEYRLQTVHGERRRAGAGGQRHQAIVV